MSSCWFLCLNTICCLTMFSLSLCLSLPLSVSPCLCLSVCLSVCLSLSLSIPLSLSLSLSLSLLLCLPCYFPDGSLHLLRVLEPNHQRCDNRDGRDGDWPLRRLLGAHRPFLHGAPGRESWTGQGSRLWDRRVGSSRRLQHVLGVCHIGRVQLLCFQVVLPSK